MVTQSTDVISSHHHQESTFNIDTLTRVSDKSFQVHSTNSDPGHCRLESIHEVLWLLCHWFPNLGIASNNWDHLPGVTGAGNWLTKLGDCLKYFEARTLICCCQDYTRPKFTAWLLLLRSQHQLSHVLRQHRVSSPRWCWSLAWVSLRYFITLLLVKGRNIIFCCVIVITGVECMHWTDNNNGFFKIKSYK